MTTVDHPSSSLEGALEVDQQEACEDRLHLVSDQAKDATTFTKSRTSCLLVHYASQCIQGCCRDLYVDYVILGWFGIALTPAPSLRLPLAESGSENGDYEEEQNDDAAAALEAAPTILQQAFGPPHVIGIFFKCLFLFLGLSVLLLPFLQHPELFWFAYLTHWTLCVAVSYQVLSLCLSLACWRRLPLFSVQVQANNNDHPQTVVVVRLTSTFLKIYWILFSLAVTTQTTVAILFWTIEYDPHYVSLSFYTCMAHGGVCVLIWMDGFWINRIPLRLKHMWSSIGYSTLYFGWTLIHDFALRGRTALGGNPDRQSDNADEDDDAIYFNFSWIHHPWNCVVLFGQCILILIPVVYLTAWWISQKCWRMRTASSHSKNGGMEHTLLLVADEKEHVELVVPQHDSI